MKPIDFSTFIETYEPTVNDTVVTYGPENKEGNLVPQLTFWGKNEDCLSMSWGLVNINGDLIRGQVVHQPKIKQYKYQEGNFSGKKI